MTIPTLRPYQLEAVQRTYQEMYFRKSTLRVACTGSGKTHEAAATIRIWLKRYGQRVLFIAPRDELLSQARETILEWNPALRDGLDVSLERGAKKSHPGSKVILASIQSLYDDRLKQIAEPDLIIADEAHLYFDALERIFDEFPKAKRIGWTATPDRSDTRRLLPHLFESVAAVYEIGQAIEDGYLAKPLFRRVELSTVRLDSVEMSSEGDFKQVSLSKQMCRLENLHGVAQATLMECGQRQTVVFAVDLAHASSLAATFNIYQAGVAKAISGHMPLNLRREILSQFVAGDFQVLVSVVLLTYGWDAPPVSCVVMARPTHSRALYCQSIGRGLRPYPGKDDCLVLDIVGNTASHTLITPELALKPDETLEFIERASEIGVLSADEAIDRKVIDTLLSFDGEGDTFRTINYRVTAVDNQLAMIDIDAGERNPDSPAATEKQVAYLRDLGLDDSEMLSAEQASEVISRLVEREGQGWCTLKQAMFLQRKRLNPNVKREKATWAIEKIRDNRWKVPRHLLLDEELVYRGTKTLVIGHD